MSSLTSKRLGVDGHDLYFGVRLSVAHFSLLAFFGFVSENGYLLGLAVLQDLSGNAGALNYGGTDNGLAVLTYDSYLLELDVGILFSVQFLNENDVAFGHAVLLTAGYDDCVHVTHLPYIRLAVWGRHPKMDALIEPGTRGSNIVTHLPRSVNGVTPDFSQYNAFFQLFAITAPIVDRFL